MRMRRGFTDFSASAVVDFMLRAKAPAAALETLINWRRVVLMGVVTFLVVPREATYQAVALCEGLEENNILSISSICQ
jgi:hypothetical protein